MHNDEPPKPRRIQRKRTKGYNMQAHSKWINGLEAVSVARPGRWGNPYVVGEDGDAAECVRKFHDMLIKSDDDLTTIANVRAIRDELQGKNLACFCPLDQECHADLLLSICANDDKWDL